jgi:hypothetical protein
MEGEELFGGEEKGGKEEMKMFLEEVMILRNFFCGIAIQFTF